MKTKFKLLSLFAVLLLLLGPLFGCKKDSASDAAASMVDAETLQVHFIDVGQADATLVLCAGKAMMIDGGNVSDSSLIYSYLKKHSIDHLDYMIATHPHEDHIGGLSGALNFASVDKVYTPTKNSDSETFEIFAEQVEKNGADLYVPEAGESFMLGDARVDILGCNSADGTNNASIVLKITYGETSFLFTGDAEREAETKILESGANLKSTVLKVGHHGSSTSTSYPFLREIMPDYAVISVGRDNSYGHPHEEATSRLEDAGAKIYRTDELGTIICESDGKSVFFSFEKNKIEGKTENKEQEGDYVLNTSSKKFHIVSCSSVSDMSEKNKELFTGSRDELISDGYSPCKSCNP